MNCLKNLDTDQVCKLTETLSRDGGVHFIIHEPALRALCVRGWSAEGATDLVLKKSLLYSTNVVLLTESATEWTGTGLSTGSKHFFETQALSVALKEVLDRHEASDMFARCVHVLPARIDHYIEEFEDEDHWVTSCGKGYSFSEVYRNEFGIPVSFTDPQLLMHLLSVPEARLESLTCVDVVLPELKHVPLGELLKVREDNQDAFFRFQHALKGLMTSSRHLGSEQMLRDSFAEVSHEVRVFQQKVEAIARSRALASYEAAVGVCTMGLCLLVPDEVAKMLASAIGIFGTGAFVKGLFSAKDKMDQLATSSDYYLPWRAGQAGP